MSADVCCGCGTPAIVRTNIQMRVMNRLNHVRVNCSSTILSISPYKIGLHIAAATSDTRTCHTLVTHCTHCCPPKYIGAGLRAEH